MSNNENNSITLLRKYIAIGCYNTAASGGINGADVEGQAEAKTAAEFASADMAVLLNGDQTDAPWEYIEGNATPTLKFFNKNKN